MEKNNIGTFDLQVLRAFQNSREPTGTWNILRKIREENINVSEATVGRILNKLEEEGFLVKVDGRKGRELTQLGIEHLRMLEQENKREDYLQELVHSIGKDSLESVKHQIQVRKLLEPIAAREASLNATQEDIAKIRETVHQLRESLDSNKNTSDPSINFHLYIAQACKNKILSSFIQILIEERKYSDMVDAIGWKRNTRSERDHELILDAIEQRDPDTSERLMLLHLQRIEDLIDEEFNNT